MNRGVAYYRNLYQKNSYKAAALDVETEAIDGPISVLSIYKKIDDQNSELVQLTQGDDLNARAIQQELNGVKILLTFNGLEFDLPLIEKHYPASVSPNIQVIDLFKFARAIGFKGGLKDLEKVLGISRTKQAAKGAGKTHKLWMEYIQQNKRSSLNDLLEYAAADVLNLYELADVLMAWAKAKLAVEEVSSELEQTGIDRFQNLILPTPS